MQLTRPLVLASNSPRRQQLLREMGCTFRVDVRPTDEVFPADMPVTEVPAFLARQKADRFREDLGDQLVLCADTIVVVDTDILNKPADTDEAVQMLRRLSGRPHRVITGVCLLSAEETVSFIDEVTVYFNPLDDYEINSYVEKYRPLDKAGAYGVQEPIGMIGIQRIEGSFYTVMGLPVHLVYQALKSYELRVMS